MSSLPKFQGQEQFQISGDVSEEATPTVSEADIQTVMEKTGCSQDDAAAELEKNGGDMAEAIISLSS